MLWAWLFGWSREQVRSVPLGDFDRWHQRARTALECEKKMRGVA